MTDHQGRRVGVSQIRQVSNAVVIGASGGIGSALVEALLARTDGVVHAFSRSAGTTSSARVIAGTIDTGDEASIAAAAAAVRDTGAIGTIIVATGLLHSATVQPEKTFRSLNANVLAEYFAVNAIGPALVAKHFLPLLPRKERAVFACLSARVGSIGDNRLGGWYGYRASKAALNMLIKTLSIEIARTAPGVICVGLHPGTVETALSAPFRQRITGENLFTPAVSAERLLGVMDALAPEQSGGCFAWDGHLIEP